MEFDGTNQEEYLQWVEEHDYLGKAATAKNSAAKAIKDKRFDEAWGLFQEQKLCYMRHCSFHKFSKSETMALDGSVSEDLANVLRLEKKHALALVHIIYWITSSPNNPLSRHPKKLKAYFNRCKFTQVTEDDLSVAVRRFQSKCDFREIQFLVSSWGDRE